MHMKGKGLATATRYSRAEADALAGKLAAEDEDGWTYYAICAFKGRPDVAVVEVYDEEVNFLGYL